MSAAALVIASALFAAEARNTGWDIDARVREIDRQGGVSRVQAPGFHERTAAQARWFMCAAAALAQRRGATHWWMLYPAPGDDVLTVAITDDPRADATSLFGADVATQRLLGRNPAPVANFARLCGIPERWQ